MTRVSVAAAGFAISAAVTMSGFAPSPATIREKQSSRGLLRATVTLASCADPTVPAGTATLIEESSEEAVKNVTVRLFAENLTPGKHAVIIHEVGSCEPTCAAAGSHLDLGPHASNVPVTEDHPFHSGDLINVEAGDNGRGVMSHVTNRVALSPGRLSVFDLNGASIVIHALPDTYCPDPSDPNCAGGGRVACGVIVPVQ